MAPKRARIWYRVCVISPSVELLDGFKGHADALRAAGLAAYYHRLALRGPGGEQLSSDLIAPAPLGPSEAVISGLGERIGARFRLISASYRVNEVSHDSEHGWSVAGGHPADVDLELCVLSLAEEGHGPASNRNHHPGLAFWRHSASGDVQATVAIPSSDRFIRSSWTMQGLARLTADRLVVCPASSFVSLWPGTAPPSIEPVGSIEPHPLIWAAYVHRES